MEEKKEAGSSPAKKTTVRSFICMFLFCLDWPIGYSSDFMDNCNVDWFLTFICHKCFILFPVFVLLFSGRCGRRWRPAGCSHQVPRTHELWHLNHWWCVKTKQKTKQEFPFIAPLITVSARVFYFLRAWINRLFQLIRLLQLDCRMLQNTIRLCCVCKLSPVNCVFFTTTSS